MSVTRVVRAALDGVGAASAVVAAGAAVPRCEVPTTLRSSLAGCGTSSGRTVNNVPEGHILFPLFVPKHFECIV